MKNKSLEKTINRVATKVWQRHLSKEGVREFSLDPAKYTAGECVTSQLQYEFGIGVRKFRRTIQRTFYTDRTTKVPAIYAFAFQEGLDLIEAPLSEYSSPVTRHSSLQKEAA